LTPSSSTSTLNDIRNKPLPPNNADHAALAAQGQLGNTGANPGAPDRFNTGGPGQGANGGGTPVRHGPLPPTVIISPSAPVRPGTVELFVCLGRTDAGNPL
jgi:serine/threonine-protein phosphatase 2A regulatory subunit B'